ncbi:MAG: arginine--tRNA ligase, partial [Kiritimatiellae bacterium]|nr:arginine--tRNA ligase [Kiritimatiellia bacterium]
HGMQTPNQILTDWMRLAFRTAFPGSVPNLSEVTVSPTASPEFGDYQCNNAMKLAKAMGKSPREIAETVIRSIPLHDALEEAEVAGPGFINLRLKGKWLATYVTAMDEDSRLAVPLIGNGQTVVMDYGSPNITKPLHIGHLRSHNIGSALDRMYRFLGYHVIADNHIGDWGTQFGITILGYRHFGNEDAMRERPLEELERVYVASYARAKTDEEWMARCRQELVKLQTGDPENRALWERFVRLSLQELDRIYKRLGISYDLVRGESYYNDRLEYVVRLLEDKGIARKSEGATVVFLDDEKLPPCIVRKSDGAFNYATTDIATTMSRVEEFKPERIVYVTDERQQLHFKQVFAICRRLGYTTRLDHVWFGLMRMPDSTISTREGNVIRLEALLDEAERRALQIVRTSSPEMSPEQQMEVARAVGIGAVKYADLSQNPQSLVVFSWEKALALDGNSAPYLQYATARIASVLDKYREHFPAFDLRLHPVNFSLPLERTIALKVARFPETVVQAAETYRPNLLADHLYDLAQTYNSYYQNVPFLKSPEGIRESRVRLCGIVARVLRTGLRLLGIDTPDRI